MAKAPMLSLIPRLPRTWLGNTDSYLRVAEMVRHALDHTDSHARFDAISPEETPDENRTWEEVFLDEASDEIIEVNGRVGLVRVDGPLVNENSFWNLLFGLTSYDTVTTALQKVMLEEPSVEYAVMVMSSGGGSADGVENFSHNVRALKKASDTTLLTHIQSAALSAGYWLGAHGDVIYGNKMAEAGSIGVVLTHRSIEGLLEKEGIKDTLIYSGSEKVVAHPSKDLSEKDKEILQRQSDRMYQFFTEHVITERHLSRSNLTDWADGKTFFMDEAVQLGLADFVMPLQALLEDLNEGFEEQEEPVPSGATELDNIRRGEPIVA